MSGDYLHVGRDLRNYLLDAVDHAIYAAAAADVDERESVGYEVVAHVHHVGLGEKDDRIAVGVASGKVESANVLAYRGADVPRVRALQHVDAASDLGDFDLNLGEILLLGPDRDTAKQQAQAGYSYSEKGHRSPEVPDSNGKPSHSVRGEPLV